MRVVIKSFLFREWLLTKIVNGERASYSAPKFARMQERTRSQMLEDIVANLQNHAETGQIPKPYRRGRCHTIIYEPAIAGVLKFRSIVVVNVQTFSTTIQINILTSENLLSTKTFTLLCSSGSWRPIGHMRPSSPLLDSVRDQFEDYDQLAKDFTRVFLNNELNCAQNAQLFDVVFLVGQSKQKTKFIGVRAILGVRSRYN